MPREDMSTESSNSNNENFRVPGEFDTRHEGNIVQKKALGLGNPDMLRFQDDDNEPDPSKDMDPNVVNRMMHGSEALSSELIARAKRPHDLIYGVRRLEETMEDGNVPGPLGDHWTPPQELRTMMQRTKNLKIPVSDLEALDWVTDYDPKTGWGQPTDVEYTSLALFKRQDPVYMEYKDGTRRQIDTEVSYNYGTPEKRAEMAKTYERLTHELEARAIINEHVGLRLNPDFRDNLGGLVTMLKSGRMPKFKADHLKALFNMPGLAESKKEPENTRLGDQLEEAIMLNRIMLHSGTKQQMLGYLEKPGVKYLIARMAKEQESRTGEDYTSADWIRDNIGDVKNWVDDKVRKDDTFLKDESGLRKDLTKWSNMAAFGGNPGDMGGDDEIAFIEKAVGGLCGSVEAAWVASSFLRAIGTYSSMGVVDLPGEKKKPVLELGSARYIASDDTGKLLAYAFNMKEGTKGNPSGLKNMIGKIPDLAMDLFDWAQVKVQLEDGTWDRRSVWDAWEGTVGGLKKIDLLKGVETDQLTKKEDYHRLGDLKFETLDKGFHDTFAIMQWLSGSDQQPTGVLPNALEADFDFKAFLLNKLKKDRKYVQIVFNKIVMTKGSPHLYVFTPDKRHYEDENDRMKEIPFTMNMLVKNFMRNLMLARINSYSFSTQVLNYTVPTTEPDVKEVGIPGPVLAQAFIKEVLKDNPGDEEEVKKHYIDAYSKLTSLAEVDLKVAKIKNAGTIFDRFAILKEQFLPEDPYERTLVGYVGKVTGKKK